MLNKNYSHNVSIVMLNAYIIIISMLVVFMYGLYALTSEDSGFMRHCSENRIISYEEDVNIDGESIKAFLLFEY